MIRLYKVKGKDGMFQSHSKGLIEPQLEFFHGLTKDNRLVLFTDDDGNVTLRLSKFGAVKDEVDETLTIEGA
ncbi:MAG: hypothetical protein NUV80_07435 [Candidatus Berkelbacteria bacterium]|nr:hypothetical protein [Candidatus Berkelbacteria bacterium]